MTDSGYMPLGMQVTDCCYLQQAMLVLLVYIAHVQVTKGQTTAHLRLTACNTVEVMMSVVTGKSRT